MVTIIGVSEDFPSVPKFIWNVGILFNSFGTVRFQKTYKKYICEMENPGLKKFLGRWLTSQLAKQQILSCSWFICRWMYLNTISRPHFHKISKTLFQLWHMKLKPVIPVWIGRVRRLTCNHASYFRGPGLKSLPRVRLSWMGFLYATTTENNRRVTASMKDLVKLHQRRKTTGGWPPEWRTWLSDTNRE